LPFLAGLFLVGVVIVVVVAVAVAVVVEEGL